LTKRCSLCLSAHRWTRAHWRWCQQVLNSVGAEVD